MRKFITIGCICVAAAALLGGVLWWEQSQSAQSNADAAAVFTNAGVEGISAAAVVPEGSLAYQNTQYKFSLVYPKELSVSEYAEAAGSHTTSFEDASGEKGFQIFALPYKDIQITSSRIKEDTHGTAAGAPKEVILASGVHALLFESSDPKLGRVREVWFLHGGYLYEVSTYLGLDEWLAGIMATWRFI